MDLIPAADSLRRNQNGLGAAGLMPATRTVTNRPQPIGSAIVTGQPGSVRGGTACAAGSVNGRSKAAAISRARPRMDSA